MSIVRNLRRNHLLLLLPALVLGGGLPSRAETTSEATSEATYGQQVIAAVLLAEARSEGSRGMNAVAEVIRTRAEHFHASPLAVVKMRKQFSCLNGITPPELIRRLCKHADWDEAIAIAKVLYNEPHKLPGIVGGATHYHSGRRVFWAKGQRPVAVVGALKFYRLSLPKNNLG